MKFKLKIGNFFVLIVLITTLILAFSYSLYPAGDLSIPNENSFNNAPKASNYEQFSKGNFTGYEFSNYNLSVILDETTSSVLGNLTVDFYNNDPLSFTQLPFHIYASGMQYENRPGYIQIINVTTLGNPKLGLDFEVFSDDQLMWINLTETLNPTERVNFSISFNTTLPDGGIDRASDSGYDHNYSRIFKFASCYPMPCVYDEFDEWNTDRYLLTGDPFYSEMAYYDLIVNVPKNMTVAATGELLQRTIVGNRIIHHFNPHLPVREVTFSASRYFIVESVLINGIVDYNISTYFLPKSDWYWHNFALSITTDAVGLFNSTFGLYPYSTFNVVEEYTHYGGMEYPLQVYISEAADRHPVYDPYWYVETVIAHETCHQWFYQLVGNDQIDWGFLDEGIVCWATDYYKEVFHPNWDIFEPYWALEDVRHYNLDYGLPNKINQSIYDCFLSGTDYYYLGYTKAPMIFEKLRLTVGHNAFISSLSTFFKQFYFQIGLLSDLQQTFETVLGSSLDWFFLPWFDNVYLPKYNFSSAIYDATAKELTLTIVDSNEALNTYSYSQEVPLIIRGAVSILYNDTVWINGTTTLTIPLDPGPAMIMLSYHKKDILVQFSDYYIDFLITTDIDVINIPIVPGYNFSIFLSLTVSGIIIIITKSRKNVIKN